MIILFTNRYIFFRINKRFLYFYFNESSVDSLMRELMNNHITHRNCRIIHFLDEFKPLFFLHQLIHLYWLLRLNHRELIKILPNIIISSFVKKEIVIIPDK